MTRAQVIVLGFLVLLLGGGGYYFFRFIGFEGASAGIASEAVLIGGVLLWIVSYLVRVFTGNMTFMEQRKRYRKAYEEITDEELLVRFESLSEDDQLNLIQEIERDKNSPAESD